MLRQSPGNSTVGAETELTGSSDTVGEASDETPQWTTPQRRAASTSLLIALKELPLPPGFDARGTVQATGSSQL